MKFDKESITNFVWGMVAGAIVLLAVIFWAGWVVTSSTAHSTAEKMSEDAVLARLAPICVTQFNQDPEKDQKLKELKDISSWQRGDYVRKQVWATIPGEEEPDREVTNECAKQLIQISQ